MKIKIFTLLGIFGCALILGCSKPKPACGTSKEKAKKYKKLQANPNFKM